MKGKYLAVYGRGRRHFRQRKLHMGNPKVERFIQEIFKVTIAETLRAKMDRGIFKNKHIRVKSHRSYLGEEFEFY